ncbi:MAG: glycosyltransferase family 2 protein [Planctomyces sp.]|nr:glycosyltransferase family 2 protein [Planctomyces sp.]
MSSELPFVSCLCPTYRRPKLLENSIACFLAQDYPTDRRELIVLDDAGELQSQNSEGWQIISIPRRFRSLPEKFNALAGLARGEILVVWEDDDIYLPHHISSHVAAMNGYLWSKPSKVLSDYTDQIEEEDATGRFHASLAFTRLAFEQVGGWPLTLRGDFDQQLISRLNSIGPAGDPCSVVSPSYVFRWRSTGAYHGQALMRGPDDEQWYQRAFSDDDSTGSRDKARRLSSF